MLNCLLFNHLFVGADLRVRPLCINSFEKGGHMGPPLHVKFSWHRPKSRHHKPSAHARILRQIFPSPWR